MERSLTPNRMNSYYDELDKVREAKGYARGHGVSVYSTIRQSVRANDEQQRMFGSHPHWREWETLSPEVQAACRNDFRIFLSTRSAGLMPSLIELVGKNVEREAMAARREGDRTALEREVAAAGDPAQQARILEERNASQNEFQREIAAANARALARS